MSAQHPHDQHPDASARPAATPSVRDVLAACAAARTLSTPPGNPVPAVVPAARTHEEKPRRRPNRDAA